MYHVIHRALLRSLHHFYSETFVPCTRKSVLWSNVPHIFSFFHLPAVVFSHLLVVTVVIVIKEHAILGFSLLKRVLYLYHRCTCYLYRDRYYSIDFKSRNILECWVLYVELRPSSTLSLLSLPDTGLRGSFSTYSSFSIFYKESSLYMMTNYTAGKKYEPPLWVRSDLTKHWPFLLNILTKTLHTRYTSSCGHFVFCRSVQPLRQSPFHENMFLPPKFPFKDVFEVKLLNRACRKRRFNTLAHCSAHLFD